MVLQCISSYYCPVTEYVVRWNNASYEFIEGESSPLVCLSGEGETAKPAEIMMNVIPISDSGACVLFMILVMSVMYDLTLLRYNYSSIH